MNRMCREKPLLLGLKESTEGRNKLEKILLPQGWDSDLLGEIVAAAH